MEERLVQSVLIFFWTCSTSSFSGDRWPTIKHHIEAKFLELGGNMPTVLTLPRISSMIDRGQSTLI